MNAPLFPLETIRLRVEAASPPDVTTGAGHGKVLLKSTGEAIGTAGIVRLPFAGDGAFALEISVDERYRGSGYARELARTFVSAAFARLRLSEIYALVPDHDGPARTLAASAGFRSTARSGEADGMTIFALRAPPATIAPRIKMCGMTSPYDAELAVLAGADAVGLIFARSDRRVTLATAREIVRSLPGFVDRVAVFVDAPGDEVRAVCEELGAMPQFSGSETAAYAEAFGGERYVRVLRVKAGDDAQALVRVAAESPRALPFFETLVPGAAGGTGHAFDWSLAAPAAQHARIGISGGLTPDNVGHCIAAVRPYAVDVRSGVERDGRKDFERMRAFTTAARAAFAAVPAYA